MRMTHSMVREKIQDLWNWIKQDRQGFFFPACFALELGVDKYGSE